jgi:hypothetical protein
LKVDDDVGCQLPSAFSVGQERIDMAVSSPTATEHTPDGVRSNDSWSNHSLQVQRACVALTGGGSWQVLDIAHTGAATPPSAPSSSPVLSAINVLDVLVPGTTFELFYSIGSSGNPTDFAPRRIPLHAGSPSIKLAPYGGRSSDQVMPMFHFISQDTTSAKSFWVGIGWTGKWAMETTVGMKSACINVTPCCLVLCG